MIFNGDGYSQEWHDEAEQRGLPNLRDTVAALPKLREQKAIDLFAKYDVLKEDEVRSRVNTYLENYVKQMLIETETMHLMGRQMIMPAALAQQKRIADTVVATEAAGVDCADLKSELGDFVKLVYAFNANLAALSEADNFETEDLLEHATYLKHKVVPIMDRLRQVGDELELRVAADLWPMPSYRELLFIK